MVEEWIDSTCTVDNEIDPPHVTTDNIRNRWCYIGCNKQYYPKGGIQTHILHIVKRYYIGTTKCKGA